LVAQGSSPAAFSHAFCTNLYFGKGQRPASAILVLSKQKQAKATQLLLICWLYVCQNIKRLTTELQARERRRSSSPNVYLQRGAWQSKINSADVDLCAIAPFTP